MKKSLQAIAICLVSFASIQAQEAPKNPSNILIIDCIEGTKISMNSKAYICKDKLWAADNVPTPTPTPTPTPAPTPIPTPQPIPTVVKTGKVVYAENFPGKQICQQMQNAIDSLQPEGGTVIVTTPGGDCGDVIAEAQVQIKAFTLVQLPIGTFKYSLRGYGGKFKEPCCNKGNLIGALFVLDSDSALKGSGPGTVIEESSWVYTNLPEAQQRGAISNGEYIAQHIVIATTATAHTNGSTSQNITVSDLTISEGKPVQASGFNSAGGALLTGNCHNCHFYNLHFKGLHGIAFNIGGSSINGLDPAPDLIKRGITKSLGRFAENVILRDSFFFNSSSQNAAAVNCRGCYFLNNVFRNPGYDSQFAAGTSVIDIEPDASTDIIEDIVIKGNIIDASQALWPNGTKLNNGIVIQNGAGAKGWQNISVEDNKVFGSNLSVLGQGVSGSCILVRNNAHGVRITNNTLTGCRFGITFDFNSNDGFISHNTIISSGRGAGAFSILIDGSSNNVITYNQALKDKKSVLFNSENLWITEGKGTGTPSNNRFLFNYGNISILGQGSVGVGNISADNKQQ